MQQDDGIIQCFPTGVPRNVKTAKDLVVRIGYEPSEEDIHINNVSVRCDFLYRTFALPANFIFCNFPLLHFELLCTVLYCLFSSAFFPLRRLVCTALSCTLILTFTLHHPCWSSISSTLSPLVSLPLMLISSDEVSCTAAFSAIFGHIEGILRLA